MRIRRLAHLSRRSTTFLFIVALVATSLSLASPGGAAASQVGDCPTGDGGIPRIVLTLGVRLANEPVSFAHSPAGPSVRYLDSDPLEPHDAVTGNMDMSDQIDDQIFWSLHKTCFDGLYLLQNARTGLFLTETTDNVVVGTDVASLGSIWKMTDETSTKKSFTNNRSGQRLTAGTQRNDYDVTTSRWSSTASLWELQ